MGKYECDCCDAPSCMSQGQIQKLEAEVDRSKKNLHRIVEDCEELYDELGLSGHCDDDPLAVDVVRGVLDTVAHLSGSLVAERSKSCEGCHFFDDHKNAPRTCHHHDLIQDFRFQPPEGFSCNRHEAKRSTS